MAWPTSSTDETASILLMHEVDLFRIGPEDWSEFREVRLASLYDSPGAFGSLHADWVAAGQERWRTRLTDVPFTLVARRAGGPVGVACGSESEGAVELISMWVAPGERGTGLAGRLAERVVTWAEDSGRRTFLMVREDNISAIRAYARAGFVDHGVPEDWPDDAPRERRMWHDGTNTSGEQNTPLGRRISRGS